MWGTAFLNREFAYDIVIYFDKTRCSICYMYVNDKLYED